MSHGCCNVAWSRCRVVTGMQCCSVAGIGVVCIEMFFAGPAFRIVNSQIGKKSLWVWIFCRLQAMCCFANSHYAKKLRQMGSVLQNFRHIEVFWLLNITVLLFTGKRIGGSEGILKQISPCSSRLVLKKRNLGIHEFQAGGKTDESSDTGQIIFYLGIHDECS